MVQVKGRLRLLTQRFSKDFAGRVKYSTSCPSRRDSPSEASRAMPTSEDFCETGNRGNDNIVIRLLFAYLKFALGCRQVKKVFRDSPTIRGFSPHVGYDQ